MAALGWGRDNFYIAKYDDFECFWTLIWLAPRFGCVKSIENSCFLCKK